MVAPLSPKSINITNDHGDINSPKKVSKKRSPTDFALSQVDILSSLVSANTGFTPKKWAKVVRKLNKENVPIQGLDFEGGTIKKADLRGPGIYEWVNETTGEAYVGKSDDLIKRLTSHFHLVNKPDATGRKKNPKQRLYPDVNNPTSNFSIGVTPLNGDSPRQVEKIVIASLKEKGLTLYNLDNGGGGPKAKRKLLIN